MTAMEYYHFAIKVNNWCLYLDNNFYVALPGQDIGKPHYLNEEGILTSAATYFPNIKTCIEVIDKHFAGRN